uniref:cd7 antigen-like n=1 Tax=Semicossyphus pulcher TaxID=241346 RepID=UPI0037E8247C
MVKMRGIWFLACLWSLIIGCVLSDIQFLERSEGESVVLPCVVVHRGPAPFGMSLMRSWLHPTIVLFFLNGSDFEMDKSHEKNRTSVSGYPSSRAVNVTISHLRASDTDRYYCEFVVDNSGSEDLRVRGNTEFFLLVTAAAPASMDIGLVETCAGGSAVLPCLPPRGEALPVVGVSLKRQRGQRAPVEMLYHSKHHRSSSAPSFSSSLLPDERVQLALVSSPSGITYNLTLLQLRPEDSGLYSCSLLLRGQPDSHTSLGRQVFFVSVQGQCGCSSYSTLLYALSAAVVFLLFLLLVGFVVSSKGKARRRVKSHPQAPIYEEMAGVKADSRKLSPRHLEEMDSSEYKNCNAKKSCSENHYEQPSGGLYPRREPETKY